MSVSKPTYALAQAIQMPRNRLGSPHVDMHTTKNHLAINLQLVDLHLQPWKFDHIINLL